MSASSVRSAKALSSLWIGRLASYRQHTNDEHREALIEEALRFSGFHLEDDLSRSSYWSDAPLARRVAVLLFLVDRGAVVRVPHRGRIVYEAVPGAESWVTAQPALVPYLPATLDLIAALRNHQARRLLASD